MPAEPAQASEPVPPAVPAPTESAPAAVAAPTPAPAPPAPDLLVSAPRFDVALLDNPKPAYPAMARRLGVQGTVRLRVLVSAAGLAEKVELKESSGSDMLDRAAQEAIRRWRFVPAKRGEAAFADWVVVPIKFTLRD
jgi:protein TonB